MSPCIFHFPGKIRNNTETSTAFRGVRSLKPEIRKCAVRMAPEPPPPRCARSALGHRHTHSVLQKERSGQWGAGWEWES